jgi:ubiquinone/menaquinone biosynthesis C-methylase UbiE
MHRIPEPEVMDTPDRAEAYARTDFSAVNQAFVDRLLALAGELREGIAVDLGTGPGDIPIRVQQRRPDWKIFGADASPPMLRFATRATSVLPTRTPLFTLCDAKRLPFADASIDIVFSNSILHHLPDPLPYWQEVRRIAKPGALIFVRDLFRPETPADAQRLVDTHARDAHPLLREDFYNSFLAAFTPEEIRAQLIATGLSALDVIKVTDRHVDILGHTTRS